MSDKLPPKRKKFCYLGPPAIYILELECKHINKAFDSYGFFLVGSVLERPDFRDVDIRLIMEDAKFEQLFPNAGPAYWEFDPRWLIMNISISEYLSKKCGYHVDFQIQKASHANSTHKGAREAIGMNFSSE